MNTTKIIFRFSMTAAFLLGAVPEMNAQLLKRLGKAAERAAERTVERRVEQESAEKTDQALDRIFEKDSKQKSGGGNPVPTGSGPDSGPSISESFPNSDNETKNQKSTRTVSRASDFEPDAVTIFEDDFGKDGQGDFPAQWDTNGSGEIVLIDQAKWFRLGGRSTYIPLVTEGLPENYTIEFDLLVQGLDGKTSSQSWIRLLLEDTPLFTKPGNFAMVELSPCQFIAS